MKKIIAVALMALAGEAWASPYFRLGSLAHPQENIGAFVDPVAPGQTSVGKYTAIITHSPNDGCLFPSVICESWSPLSAGLSANGGKILFGMGPSVNLSDMMVSALERTFSIAPLNPLGKSWISVGPSLTVTPIQGGTIIPVSKWQGRAKIFCGAAWQF